MKTKNSESESLWTKAPVANLVRYEPSGIYFARAKVRGKLIRKSLDTNVLSVAKLRLADVLDFLAPLPGFGLMAGRIGNFINGELWGRPTTLPWGFGVPDAQGVLMIDAVGGNGDGEMGNELEGR